jgi:stage II sporulation protein D
LKQRPLFPILAFTATAGLAAGILVYSCSVQTSDVAPLKPISPTGDTVRVLLSQSTGGRTLQVAVEGTALLSTAGGWERIAGGTHAVKATAGGVAVGERGPTAELRLACEGGAVLGIGAVSYAGTLRVRGLPGNVLEVVNEVPLETYLLGVVGGEMPPSWEMEALKAQAVAARTYAAARMRAARGADAPFDLYDDTRSQVYAGVPPARYASRLARAVGATEGEVLVHEGELLTAFFHSTCGGHTESAHRVFGSADRAPLKGVPCDGCVESPLFRWEVKIPAEDLEGRLGVKGVKTIRADERGPSGRCGAVRLVAEEGETVLTGKDFRWKLGVNRLRSTAFEATREGDGFLFTGKGFGHGVGLCQWGARGLARKGKDCLQILEHYYPGAMVLQVAALPRLK